MSTEAAELAVGLAFHDQYDSDRKSGAVRPESTPFSRDAAPQGRRRTDLPLSHHVGSVPVVDARRRRKHLFRPSMIGAGGNVRRLHFDLISGAGERRVLLRSRRLRGPRRNVFEGRRYAEFVDRPRLPLRTRPVVHVPARLHDDVLRADPVLHPDDSGVRELRRRIARLRIGQQ